MATTKDYMSLTPEQHFMTVYKSKIEKTGEKISMYDPVHVSYGPNPFMQHLEQRTENVICIKFAETEYNRFMRGYSDYLTLIYGIKDPVARDMFEKLMIYLKLRE